MVGIRCLGVQLSICNKWRVSGKAFADETSVFDLRHCWHPQPHALCVPAWGLGPVCASTIHVHTAQSPRGGTKAPAGASARERHIHILSLTSRQHHIVAHSRARTSASRRVSIQLCCPYGCAAHARAYEPFARVRECGRVLLRSARHVSACLRRPLPPRAPPAA